MSDANWWIVGWSVGGAVVLIAALLLITILMVARKIRRQATGALDVVHELREATLPLWALGDANRLVEDSLRAVYSIETSAGQIADALGGPAR